MVLNERGYHAPTTKTTSRMKRIREKLIKSLWGCKIYKIKRFFFVVCCWMLCKKNLQDIIDISIKM